MKPTAFYGGSFDPLHVGHKKLVEGIVGMKAFDRVVVALASENPLKKRTGRLPKEVRLACLQSEFGSMPKVEIRTMTAGGVATPYTVETLREMKAETPDAIIHLIIGEDNLNDFHLWKNADEIARMARIRVARRKNVPEAPPFEVPFPFDFLPFTLPAVSSTSLRKKMTGGGDPTPWIPPASLAIIRDFLDSVGTTG